MYHGEEDPAEASMMKVLVHYWGAVERGGHALAFALA
jgi:hypothetical protein